MEAISREAFINQATAYWSTDTDKLYSLCPKIEVILASREVNFFLTLTNYI